MCDLFSLLFQIGVELFGYSESGSDYNGSKFKYIYPGIHRDTTSTCYCSDTELTLFLHFFLSMVNQNVPTLWTGKWSFFVSELLCVSLDLLVPHSFESPILGNHVHSIRAARCGISGRNHDNGYASSAYTGPCSLWAAYVTGLLSH